MAATPGDADRCPDCGNDVSRWSHSPMCSNRASYMWGDA